VHILITVRGGGSEVVGYVVMVSASRLYSVVWYGFGKSRGGILSQHYYGGVEENKENLRIAGNPTEIRAKHHPECMPTYLVCEWCKKDRLCGLVI
jgi:hypothetical protein